MYFWAEESDIPEGYGYDLLSAEHVTVLVLLCAVMVGILFAYSRSREQARTRLFRTIAVILPVLEAAKICFLIRIGHMGIGYLPLHLCSMSILLYPVIAFSHNQCLQTILSEISVATLLPAAISALVFPDWTRYPMCSFMNIYAYLWHLLQVVFPLLCLIRGIARPSVRHLWWNTVFLIAVGIPIYLFDRAFSCNYWFLLRPVPGTPLVAISEMLGGKGYLPILLLTATVVNLLLYAVLGVVIRWKKAHCRNGAGN